MKISKGDKFLFKRTLITSGILLILAFLFFFNTVEKGAAVVSGVMMSAIFVISSAWIIDEFGGADSKNFLQIFFISSAIRFIVVLLLFAILLGITKINEIYFTVSFIISYLCLSVTEMIFINKILQKSSNKRP